METHIVWAWEFDTLMFGVALGKWIDAVGTGYLAKGLGVTDDCLTAWRKQEYQTGFSHPNTGEILCACNLLSIDPRDMFYLVERDTRSIEAKGF